jgi:heme exporter protein D
MINEILFMDGYGFYVWSAFAFTILSFTSLYIVTKNQYSKEKSKFVEKFKNLNSEKAVFARSQSINREILSNTLSI